MEQASTPPTLSVKNKRLKVSPSGLVTLPVSARKALGMTPGAAARIAIDAGNGRVVITLATSGGVRVSPKGMVELPAEARQIFASGTTRHYWLEAFDSAHRVVLHPFR